MIFEIDFYGIFIKNLLNHCIETKTLSEKENLLLTSSVRISKRLEPDSNSSTQFETSVLVSLLVYSIIIRHKLNLRIAIFKINAQKN